MEKYKPLISSFGYNFKRLELLVQALTHKSYANENNTVDNERLEFLGDAVLELATSELVYTKFPQAREGILTKLRANLVNEKSLANLARKIKLGRYILLGKGEEKQNGRNKDTILADTLEAILGAIYVDSQNFEKSKKIIFDLFCPLLPNNIESIYPEKDYKTLLQEYTQKQFKGLPRYTLINSTGPEHAKVFEVKLTLPDPQKTTILASASTIKKAEQLAAQKGLSFFQRQK